MPPQKKRAHRQTHIKGQARAIIAKVYDFMKKEAIENYAEKLSDARWRTSQAVGVSESTITRILRERRIETKEEVAPQPVTPKSPAENITIKIEIEDYFTPYIECVDDD